MRRRRGEQGENGKIEDLGRSTHDRDGRGNVEESEEVLCCSYRQDAIQSTGINPLVLRETMGLIMTKRILY